MGRKIKSEISVMSVVFGGLKTYLYNLDIFLKYLAFPVFGMIFGAFLLFSINYFYVTHLDKLQTSNPVFSNTAVMLTLLLVLTVPGFLIMIKAFVDYLVAFGALNSMCVLGAKRIEDVHYHNEVIKRRFAPYCVLIIVLSLIYTIFSFPILLIIAVLFLSLAVQVYTLEENSTPFSAIAKSIGIVKSNLWIVFWVLLLITVISYFLCPYLITWAIEKTPLFGVLTSPVEKYFSLLPVSDLNNILTEYKVPYQIDILLIAESIVKMTVMGAVTMFMLPYRCACCVDLYKNLNVVDNRE